MKRRGAGNAGRWLAVLLMCAVVWVMTPFTAFAAGAEASVSVDRTEAQVGDTVTLTVRIQSDGQNLGELAYRLSYTDSVLSLEDASGNNFNGNVNWASVSVGAPTYAETFVFTVIAEGSAEISFSELPTVEDEDGNAMDCSFSAETAWVQASGTAASQTSSSAEASSSVETTAPSSAESSAPDTSAADTSASSGLSDLAELAVTPGSITFDPAVTDYTVEVGNDVTRVAVSAVTADANATYIVENYDNLQVGENIVTVHVSGSDGSSKDYLIHVMRADADGSVASASVETIEGFEWTTEGRTYYITTFSDGVSIPAGYTYTPVTIGNYEVPAYANENNSGLYLIYAQEEGQEAGLCWYRSADGFVFPYVDVQSAQGGGISVPLLVMILSAIVLIVLIVFAVVSIRRRRQGPDRPDPRGGGRPESPDGDADDDWDDDDADSEEDAEDDEDEEDDEDADDADDADAAPEEGQTDDFGIDIRMMQAGIEKEVSAYGGPEQPAKSARPRKPVVDSRRINEATTRIDADRVRQNREKRQE